MADWLGTITELAALPEEEREQALQQIRLGAIANAPIEEVAKVPVSTLADYLELEIELPPQIVTPTVWRGEITCFTGRAGKGKTTFSLVRFGRWAAGLPMFDGLPDLMVPTHGPVKTLIVENEGAAGFFQNRWREILEHEGFTPEQQELVKQNILIWGDGSYSAIKVDEADKLDELRRACKEWKPDILFMDPFRSIWKGEENSATEMENALDQLQAIANDFDLGVYITHHERKSGPGEDGDAMSAARGSSALEGKCAVMERVKPVGGGHSTELTWTKNRYGLRPAEIRYRFNGHDWTYTYEADAVLDRKILELMQSMPTHWHDPAVIAEELDETQRKVAGRLTAMAKGSAPKVKRGRQTTKGGGEGSNRIEYRLLSEDIEQESDSLEFT